MVDPTTRAGLCGFAMMRWRASSTCGGEWQDKITRPGPHCV